MKSKLSLILLISILFISASQVSFGHPEDIKNHTMAILGDKKSNPLGMPSVAFENLEPEQYILEKMGNCYTNYQSNCYAEAAADFFRLFGTKKVLDIFEAEESKPQIFARCHEAAHYLGRLEYKDKQSIREAYRQCSPVCHGGCYHGVIEGYFLQKNIYVYGNQNITSEILGTCGKLEDYGQPRLYYECLHGIGHAMMLISGDELPDSLKLCDNLRNDEEREACYSGAFMESSSSSTNEYHTSKYTKADDPLYPCDIL